MGRFRRLRSPLKTESEVKPVGVGSVGSQADTPKIGGSVCEDDRNEAPADTAQAMVGCHVEMPESSNLVELCMGISVQAANSYQLMTETRFEKSFPMLCKAIDPVVPFVAQTLHRAKILAQAHGDQLIELDRQALDAADFQRVIHGGPPNCERFVADRQERRRASSVRPRNAELDKPGAAARWGNR